MEHDLRILIQLHEGAGNSMPEELLMLMRGIESPKISARMLEKITGISIHKILNTTGKKTRSGGTLNPDSLPLLLELAVKGKNPDLIMTVIKQGTSQGVVSALTGIAQSYISRTVRKNNASSSVA